MASRRGVTLRVGHVWLEPFSALTLDNVEISDPTTGKTIARVRRVAVSYDVHGVSEPKVFLKQITLTSPNVTLQREASGRYNVDDLLRSLRSNAAPSGQSGGGGLRRYVSHHMPRVRVTGLQLRVDDDQGGPLKTPSGVDLRHLRFMGASFELEDTSPVQESMALQWSARTRIEGIGGAVGAHGKLQLPLRTGEAHITLPKGFALQAGGLRAAVGGVSAWSDGRVEVTGINLAKDGENQRLALAIERLTATVGLTPVPETDIPVALRKRLPAAVLLALRHVRRVALHHPVVIGSRPSTSAAATPPAHGKSGDTPASAGGDADEDKAAADRQDDDDDAAPGRAAKKRTARSRRRLLPRATRRTDNTGKGTGIKRARAGASQAAVAVAPHRGKASSKADSTGDSKAGDTAPAAKPEPGQIVREALRDLLVGAADRMETQLRRVQEMLSAMPLEEIRVHHGSARFRGERATTGLARVVSDYNLLVKRDGASIVAELDFSVPGRKGTQRIEGRVDTKSGDMHLKVRLDQLPLAPYAAILPSNVYVHSNSALHDTRLQLVVNRKDRTISVDGSGALSHLDIRARRISRHLLADLSLRAKGRLTLDLAREMVRLTKGELAVGKVTALVDGSVLRYRTAPAFDLHVKMPTVPCQDIVDSMVPNVAPMLIGMSCHGTASLRLNLGLDTKDMRSLKLEYKPLLRKMEIDSLGKYIRFDVLQSPFEHHTRQKDGTLYTFVTGPGSDRWTPIEALGEHMPKVVTTTEDGSFYWHQGFSLNQIRSAFVTNLLRGRFVRGASTISQQVVKNLFFVEFEKTLARKLQEAIITWQMERTLDKPQILQLYFNIIEFGPQIYGIRAAASHYFNRPPSELTLLQSIWLGSIIPNPKAFYHQFTKGEVKPSWQKYLCWIGGVMRKREKITDSELARLGTCQVVFGDGTDGSETPKDQGLGHEVAIDADGRPLDPGGAPQPTNRTNDDLPLPPPKLRPSLPQPGKGANLRRRKASRLAAPSVPGDEQP